jgi:hypothetical protein
MIYFCNNFEKKNRRKNLDVVIVILVNFCTFIHCNKKN